MRKTCVKWLFFILLIFLQTNFIYGWDEIGHKLTTYIAWERMSPAVREKVTKILLSAPEDSDLNVHYDRFNSRSDAIKKRELFMYASIWSDVIRNTQFKVRHKNYHRGDWHYAAVFWKQENGKALILKNFPEAGGKAIPKLYDFEIILRNPSFKMEEKAIALAWFLHVGGDIHNPVHNASRVTQKEPKGDRGGNDFVFRKRTENQFGINLHSYWDGIVRRVKPRKNDACDADYLAPIAKKMMKKHPFSKMRNRLKLNDYKVWSEEGFKLLNEFVYQGVKRNEMPSKKYQKRTFKIASEQLALAGYRLGETLNAIFSKKMKIAAFNPNNSTAGCRIIRSVLYPISKIRKPNQKRRIALLDICPANYGKIARPMISVKTFGGVTAMREYDVVKVFENETEAKKYAKENNISDVEFK